MDDKSAPPGEACLLRNLAIQNELCDIAEAYDLDVARETGESITGFAARLIEALTEKIIDLDNAIERIETLVPDAAMED
jgi:hypothetical protein